MRIIGLLAIVALLSAAACATTASRPEAACRFDRDIGDLERIRDGLEGKTTRQDYYQALNGSYDGLAAIGARASNLTGVADPREQLACSALAAEVSMTQSYLPTAERSSSASAAAANTTPPIVAAVDAARRAAELCSSIDDARYCAIANIIATAAPAQDVLDQFYGLAADPASTSTVEQWQMADSLIDSFGETAQGWSELLDAASASPNALARDQAEDYLAPIACGVFTDAGLLRARTPGPAERDAFEAFATSYLAAMEDVADELDLTTPPAAAAACETNPDGFACREAPAGAVGLYCRSFWGAG